MYDVDERDRVAELTDLPPSSAGAPCPAIWANEHALRIAYYLQQTDGEPWATAVANPLAEAAEPVALVELRCYALMFGPPNDEAFDGHPLAKRGLGPYRMFEVLDSSWLRRLERMNAVHSAHNRERFLKQRHFVFAFHDSTIECIAEKYESEIAFGTPERVVVPRTE